MIGSAFATGRALLHLTGLKSRIRTVRHISNISRLPLWRYFGTLHSTRMPNQFSRTLLPYSTIPPTPSPPPSSQPPNHPPNHPPSLDEEKASLGQRLRSFFRRYGKLGIIVYLSISLTTFSSIYLALRTGVDVKALMNRLGVPEKGILKDAGTLALAYGIYKLLLPVRLFAAVGVTTWMAKRTSLGRRLTNFSPPHNDANR